MMGERHRSVPPPSGLGDKPAASASPAASMQLIVAPKSNDLLAKADALARITFELDLRALSGLAERLERDVRELVRRTEKNKDFRKQNEKRLAEIMREIHAVKTQMKHVEMENVGLKVDVQEQQKLMMEIISGVKNEMAGVKNLIDEFTSQGDQLRSVDNVTEETQTQQASPRMQTRSAGRAKQETQALVLQQSSTKPVSERIEEAVGSTRRWNMDRKKTPFPEGRFIANYLKQQSKRDPALAAFLQRNLQKRLRSGRTGKAQARPPRTLEEFCQAFVWQDVIDMVQDLLVKDVEKTKKLLK